MQEQFFDNGSDLKKQFIFILVVAAAIFMSGCSARYSLSTQADIDRLASQIVSLESRIASFEHNTSTQLTLEHQAQEMRYDENLKNSLKFCIERQKENFDYLKNEIAALVKPEVVILKKEDEKAKTPTSSPVVHRKMLTLDDKLVVGSVEKVHIYPSDLVMDARIDTGAETSSIDARNIEEFERDGKAWVRFTLVDRKTNTPHTIELKAVRTVKILQSSVDQGHDKRVVVQLKVTLGDKTEVSEFTLTDREHMKYPVLIGRSALKDLIIVDVSGRYKAPLIVKEENFKK